MTDARAAQHVDRIDQPLPGLFAITLSRAGQPDDVVLIQAGSPARKCAWGVVGQRPRGDSADAVVRALRERFQGARVVRLLDDHGLVLCVSRGPQQLWVVADARLGLIAQDAIDGAVPMGDPVDEHAWACARERGATMFVEHQRLLVEDARAAARAAIHKARVRLARRIDAIRGDQQAVVAAEARATHASLFVAVASRAPRGARTLDAVDYSSGEPVPVTMAFSPETPARRQLDAVFARAKRLRAGQRVADARLREAERAVMSLDDAELELDAVVSAEQAFAITTRLTRDLPRDLVRAPATGGITVRGKEVTLPKGVRSFVATSGVPIFVGKDADANDLLTVKLAKPGDLWLHARDVAGAHVVVPRWYRGGQLDAETLIDAATLAAHFSDARGEAVVDVSYTDRRFVRKPKSAARGAVTLMVEKVLPLRLEEARVARLLRA